jgi:hypothetical protein
VVLVLPPPPPSRCRCVSLPPTTEGYDYDEKNSEVRVRGQRWPLQTDPHPDPAGPITPRTVVAPPRLGEPLQRWSGFRPAEGTCRAMTITSGGQ